MDEAKLQRLKEIQEIAIDHAIEEMEAAHALSLETKLERGDRGWLTKMCGQSLTVAMRIEQFILLRKDAAGFDYRDDDEQKRAESEFVKRAEAQMKSIIARARPKFKHDA